MNIFLYLDETTWVHRLDPRTKIIGTLIVFAICLCFNDPFYIAGVSRHSGYSHFSEGHA